MQELEVMADLIVRSLTVDEAWQAMCGHVNAWHDGRISSAEALAGIGEALQANSAAATQSKVEGAPSGAIATKLIDLR